MTAEKYTEAHGEKSHGEKMDREIRGDIINAYGSLTEPSFNFERDSTRQKVYHPFLRDLAGLFLPDLEALFSIANETDVNSDHGYSFKLESGYSLYIQLSFVGRYAVLLRATRPSGLEVVDLTGGHRSLAEDQLIQLLIIHNIRLLDKETLETPIDLILFDTEPENVRIYQALFSDRDVLPWRAPRGGAGDSEKGSMV